MPYAEASTISVHLPTRSYSHYVFVTEAVELEKQYIFENDSYNLSYTINAGIYGFTNKESRNSFISALNRSSEIEVAFIAAVNQDQTATGPVEEKCSHQRETD